MFYAQLNDDNIVIGVSQLSGIITNPKMIEIPEFDDTLLGQEWNDGSFVLIPEHNVYLHITLTDSDGINPIGIQNNNTDALQVTMTFRSESSQESSVITTITDFQKRIIIKNNNDIYDIIMVNFMNGIAEFNYTTSGMPGICNILESDLGKIDLQGIEHNIKLVGDSTFEVYRVL